MLPFQPEPLDALQARYVAALSPTFNVEAMLRRGNAVCPWQLRQHVFDFERGLRLIVSRERWPDGGCRLHLSASADGELYEQIKTGTIDQRGFCGLAIDMWRLLTKEKDLRQAYLVGILEGGIPHWLVHEES